MITLYIQMVISRSRWSICSNEQHHQQIFNIISFFFQLFIWTWFHLRMDSWGKFCLLRTNFIRFTIYPLIQHFKQMYWCWEIVGFATKTWQDHEIILSQRWVTKDFWVKFCRFMVWFWQFSHLTWHLNCKTRRNWI